MADQKAPRVVVQADDGTVSELVPVFSAWQRLFLPCGHWAEICYKINPNGSVDSQIRRPESIDRYT